MAILITSDIHMTPNARDDYRWRLFQVLADIAKAEAVTSIVVLGDLTDQKDRHPASLVNRMAAGFEFLRRTASVYVLKGNHDYIEETEPFFGFLGLVHGVQYINTAAFIPMVIGGNTRNCLFVPSGRNPLGNAGLMENLNERGYASHVFAHATFAGAERENGTRFDTGLDPAMFARFYGDVISGDVHVPQQIERNIHYVGAPYHVHYGDRFRPRFLIIRGDGTLTNVYSDSFPQKIVADLRLTAENKLAVSYSVPPLVNDLVKFRVHLMREQATEWVRAKRACQTLAESKRLVMQSIEMVVKNPAGDQPLIDSTGLARIAMPREVLDDYVKQHNITKELHEVGVELLESVTR